MEEQPLADKVTDNYIDSAERTYTKYIETMNLDYDSSKDRNIEIMALNPDPQSKQSLLNQAKTIIQNIFPGMDLESEIANEAVKEYSTCKILFDHSRKSAILLFGLGTQEAPYNPVPGTPISFFENKIQGFAQIANKPVYIQYNSIDENGYPTKVNKKIVPIE